MFLKEVVLNSKEEIEELRERLYIASGQKPYPTPHHQQNTYQQTTHSNYARNLSKPSNQEVVKQLQTPTYHQPPVPSSMFPNPSSQQYPSGNQSYAPPTVTPPRKPSISNPLVSSFQSSTTPVTTFPPSNSVFPAASFPPTSSSSSAFPPSKPMFPAQSQSSLPPSNIFTPPPSAFAPPPAQRPYQPSNLPPHPPPSSRTPVHFNSEPLAPPPSSTVAPPSNFSHRSSPSPSLGGGGRKHVLDPSVMGGGSSYMGSSPYMNNVAPSYAPPLQSQFNQPTTVQPGSYNTPYSQPAPNTAPYNSMPQNFNPMPPASSLPEHKPPQHFVPQTAAAPGWNDPPALNSGSRNKVKDVQSLPQPITHPLFGATQQEMPFQGGPPMMQQHSMGFEEDRQQMYNYPGSAMPPQMSGPPLQQAAPPPAPIAKIAEPPRPKPPLPEEHMYLQTVFEELRSRCTCAANNPQLKKKLEDVSRKLEVLYDVLRENKMSGQTLASLHQIVQIVQSGDYPSALHLHTQLVSGPDFSQISAFMPGLKVLIQSALQLGVYLQ